MRTYCRPQGTACSVAVTEGDMYTHMADSLCSSAGTSGGASLVAQQ